MDNWAEAQYTVDELLKRLGSSSSDISGIPPRHVTKENNLSATWTDFSLSNGIWKSYNKVVCLHDTIISGKTICVVKGARIELFIGSKPVGELRPGDGIFLADVNVNTWDGTFSFSDTLPDGSSINNTVTSSTECYIMCFPYSTEGVYSYDLQNLLQVKFKANINIG